MEGPLPLDRKFYFNAVMIAPVSSGNSTWRLKENSNPPSRLRKVKPSSLYASIHSPTNFSVEEPLISLFTLLEKRKSPNKNSGKKSFVLHGAPTDKPSLSVQLAVSFHSEAEISIKNTK
jgi:hypothetical protein